MQVRRLACTMVKVNTDPERNNFPKWHNLTARFSDHKHLNTFFCRKKAMVWRPIDDPVARYFRAVPLQPRNRGEGACNPPKGLLHRPKLPMRQIAAVVPDRRAGFHPPRVGNESGKKPECEMAEWPESRHVFQKTITRIFDCPRDSILAAILLVVAEFLS